MKKLLILAVLFGATSASAEVVRTEQWYQAEKGEMFTELNLGYADYAYDSNGFGDTDFSSMQAQLSYEYGLTEAASWYVNTGYVMGEINSDDVEGTRAIKTGFRLQSRFESSRFISSIEIGHELESASSNNDNLNGGVYTLTIGGGYEYFLNSEAFGGYLNYSFLSSDFKTGDGTLVQTRGVPELTLYAETQRVDNFVFGVRAAYSVNGFLLYKNYRLRSGDNGSHKYHLTSGGLYARADITSTLSVLLEGDYSLTVNNEDSDFEDVDGYQAKLGVRYEF